MSTITLLFTRRTWNPVSWLIRFTVPRSRFSLALSSHCIVDAGATVYEANMLHGVRGVDRAVALKGAVVVRTITYRVPDADAGLAWAQEQADKKAPYDWPGALGLGLTPGRDWAQDDKWFCYEFAAAVLKASGRDLFANLTHVGETALLAINP